MTVIAIAVVMASVAPALAVGSASASPADHSPPAVTVRMIRVGGAPNQIAIDPRRGAAWVATTFGLARISEPTQRVVARLKFQADLVTVDDVSGVVWAASAGLDQVHHGVLAEVSERTDKVLRTRPVKGRIGGIALDPRTGTLWVSCDQSVLELSASTGRLLHTLPVATGNRFKAPAAIAVDPRHGLAWVLVLPGGPQAAIPVLDEINESAHRVIRKFGIGDAGAAALAVDPARGTVWVTLQRSVARVISEKTGRDKILRDIPNDGIAIAIDPRAKTVLSTDCSGVTCLIRYVSETTQKVTGQVQLPFLPIGVAVDPVSGNVYVPVQSSAKVSEFRV